MIKQRWTDRPPAELRADRVLLYRTGTQIGPYWQHGFQYLDKFDVVLVREGRHEDEFISEYPFGAHSLKTHNMPILRWDILWLRDNEITRRLLNSWEEWGPDWKFGFHVALYRERPLIWMIPDWRVYEEKHKEYKGFDIYANKDDNDWRASVWCNGVQLWAGVQNAYKEARLAMADARMWVDGRKG